MCVATGIRTINAQLAKLYRYREAVPISLSTSDTDHTGRQCEVVRDVDFIGGDISPHGDCKTPRKRNHRIMLDAVAVSILTTDATDGTQEQWHPAGWSVVSFVMPRVQMGARHGLMYLPSPRVGSKSNQWDQKNGWGWCQALLRAPFWTRGKTKGKGNSSREDC